MSDDLQQEFDLDDEESSDDLDESNESGSPEPKKRFNHWGAFGIVALAAIFTVIYINNVIDVNKMLKQKRVLEKELNLYKNMNKNLKFKINDLKSADRIIKIAEDSLGLIKSKSAPKIIP